MNLVIICLNHTKSGHPQEQPVHVDELEFGLNHTKSGHPQERIFREISRRLRLNHTKSGHPQELCHKLFTY